MAPSTPQVFSPVTPAQFAHLVQQAQATGIPIAGNSGFAAKFGVEVCWNYLPETQQLTLQCLRAPFFVSHADVDQKLRALVQQSLSTA
ncbi:MAG TPA: hypothetical protein VMV57_04630 [Terracidiphilus sp.]|nr:hypothetical protein [Terracidiphilus sp.]